MSVSSTARRKDGGIAETGRVVLQAFAIALVFRTCLLYTSDAADDLRV